MWQQKTSNYEGARFYHKRHWQVERQKELEKKAVEYFEMYCKLMLWNTNDEHGSEVCKEIDEFMRAKRQHHNVDPENVLQITYCNFISMWLAINI